MRFLAVTLIVAAVGVTLALTLGSTAMASPQDVVKRFIDAPSACSQWAPADRGGKCPEWIAQNPQPEGPATFSHVRVNGNRATLLADYFVTGAWLGAPGGSRFSLVRRHGVWLITGAR